MADVSTIIFKCANPECGKLIKVPRPKKSGIHSVICPHCKIEKMYNLKGQDTFPPQEGGGGTSEVTDNSGKAPIELKADILVNVAQEIACPHCSLKFGVKPEKEGRKDFQCPACHGKITGYARKVTEAHAADDEESQGFIKGKLTLLRKGWFNKSYPLGIGRHVIGRYDESEMSDISIKNDDTVSRRSARIDVDLTEKGYTFRLSVLKATNPVYRNNSPLTAGESVPLNFGDTIILGTTKFRFDKDQ